MIIRLEEKRQKNEENNMDQYEFSASMHPQFTRAFHIDEEPVPEPTEPNGAHHSLT